MPDGTIVSLVNRLAHRSGKGHTRTEMRVRSLRSDPHIAVYKTGEPTARGELTLEQDLAGHSRIRVAISGAAHVSVALPD